MRKRIFIVIISFILILMNIYGETGFIFGRVLKENRCSHEGSAVTLFDANMRLISQKETVVTGEFYFKNIDNGKYFIQINSGTKVVKKEVIKNSKNIEVKFEMINDSSKEFMLYSFTYILYLIGFIANIVILMLLKKGLNIRGKKYIYISIYIFSFTFLFNIVAFTAGLFNESIVSYCMTIGNIAGIVVPLFMYRFFMEYPVKKESKILNIIYYIGLVIALFISFVEITKIYTRAEYIKFYTLDIVRTIYRLGYNLWDIELIVLIGAVITILIWNIKSYKNKIEGEISFICLKYGIAVFILILFGSCAVNRLWDIPFGNYIDLIYVVSDILIFYGLLIGVFGFRLLEKYKKLAAVFNEVIKILILISIYFIFKHYNFIENIYLLPILLILKYLLDFILSGYLKKNIINRENIKRKIENSFNYNMVEKEITDGIKEKIGIERILILTELNRENEYSVLKNKFKDKVVFLENEDIAEEYKRYKIGIKMILEEKIRGIILLGEKEDGKIISRKEMDFLIDIAEDGAYSLNRLMSYENRKDEFIGESNIELLKEKEKKREAIEYGVSYANRIIQNIDDKEKVKKYCTNLKSAMEELQKDDKDER